MNVENADCQSCKNTRCTKILGPGGDYETVPCPECRPRDHEQHVLSYYQDPVDSDAE